MTSDRSLRGVKACSNKRNSAPHSTITSAVPKPNRARRRSDVLQKSRVQLYALSQNEVRDNLDRMFIQEEFANIQHLTDEQVHL